MIENVPLAINQNWLGAYLIPPDEIVLFEFLLYKQNYFGVSSYYYFSKRKMEDELKIGRKRLNAILKDFQDMGFLSVEIGLETTTNNSTTYFKIDFKQLAKDDVLSKLINKDCEYYNKLKKWMKSKK